MITKEVEKNKVRLYINFTLPLFCLREEYFFQTFFAFRISVVVIGLVQNILLTLVGIINTQSRILA